MTSPLRGLLALGLLIVGVAMGRHAAPDRDEAPSTPGPPSPRAMIADRLYLGRAIPGGGLVSDGEWAAFLREVVTPRFPEGLTVWLAEGQWTDPRGPLVREPVLVLEILHPPGSRADTSLATIAREYKRRFRQQAVLRVAAPALGGLL